VTEFRELPVEPAVMEKWLYRNAERVLKLEVTELEP
jgi:predicted TIM-barrel fold metal-dependent hydrolase